jgi:hypothetical protein
MGEAEGVGPVEMATHCAEHSTAIEAARARTVFACGLANAIFSKHRVYLLAANVRAQRIPRLVPAGIFPGATTPVRVVFNGGGIQTGVTVAGPPGVVGRPARHVLPGGVRRSIQSFERGHRCRPRRAPRRRRHHAWSLGQRRWRLFAEVAVFAQASRLALALRLPCRAPWASEIVLGSSGAVTVVVVPTNAPRLVGYDRSQGGRLGGGLHQPSCILKPRTTKGGNPDGLRLLPTWGATTLPFNGGPVPIWPGAKLLNLIKSMYWGCLGILGQAQAIIILLTGRPPRSHRSFGRPPIK